MTTSPYAHFYRPVLNHPDVSPGRLHGPSNWYRPSLLPTFQRPSDHLKVEVRSWVSSPTTSLTSKTPSPWPPALQVLPPLSSLLLLSLAKYSLTLGLPLSPWLSAWPPSFHHYLSLHIPFLKETQQLFIFLCSPHCHLTFSRIFKEFCFVH